MRKTEKLWLAGALHLAFALTLVAGNPQRIGHTNLLPRHSNPDDKGMYTAFIDPANGYAYFVGSYLHKVDITGNLPVEIGPATNTGQFINNAVDLKAGYVYFPGGTLKRYSLGIGTNPVTSAGSLTLAAGSAGIVLVDDADPNPVNHYAYVLCTVSGNPARIAKVALSNFTELGSVTLNAGETNFLFGCAADAQKGYAYFVTATTANVSEVVKIKMTPGTNLPVRIGAATLVTTNASIDGGSIDTVHGYAYYGTYSSDTNVPGMVCKVKLEDGDAAPTVVGITYLRAGEGRLAASVIDPLNNFVYFADDNTYPGGVYQLSLNGTNLPIEINHLQFQGGTSSTNPPNGVTAQNTTTNADGILPYGEVFFRSAVFDPVRGYAYLGQDSRPNQIVKMSVAQIDPFKLTAVMTSNGVFQGSFTNITGGSFSILATVSLDQPMTNWASLGSAMEASPGQYQFADPGTANGSQRFYRVRSP